MLFNSKWQQETKADPVSAKGILIAARKVIEHPDDWGGPLAAHGPYCAQTAICFAAHGVSAKHEAFRLFAETINVPTDTFTRIWGWNDKPGRTHVEVLAAFDRAIDLAGTQSGTASAVHSVQEHRGSP